MSERSLAHVESVVDVSQVPNSDNLEHNGTLPICK